MNAAQRPYMKMLIMRGLPGAGKSHYVRSLPNTTVMSTDQYFQCSGVYRFDPSRLDAAHADCYKRVLTTLLCGPHDHPILLVVDNTNLSIAEIAPYYAAAQAYGVSVEIVEISCDVDTAANRNLHKVPRATIERMKATMDANTALLPSWWKRTVRAPSL